MDRRNFLYRAGISVTAAAVCGTAQDRGLRISADASAGEAPLSWAAVRGEFDALSSDYIHLSSFFLVSHPRVVRERIEEHRRGLDADPYTYIEHNTGRMSGRVQAAAAEYLGGKPDEVGLTNSTTMGLALVYQGLPLTSGQEILTTAHDHFVHHEAIRLSAERSGASVRKIALFDDIKLASETEIVERIKKAVTSKTRVLGITWVHSSTGLKLPLRAIAGMVAEINRARSENDRVIIVVDGVHGFGVEDETIAATGIDFFIAGTHKWIFGPRGTGIVWARAENWKQLRMTIPAYSMETVGAWMNDTKMTAPMRGSMLSQGGFHAFEYEWSLPAAFEFHKSIGRTRIADRIHALNDQCKLGLAAMPHVTLKTPLGSKLSAGLICFEVKGLRPHEVVKKLKDKRIIASTSPYKVTYARLAPSLVNTSEEIETALREVRALT